MNILILVSYFAPDTAMAAVRPYMFAKYLTLKGHNVTVIRSGEVLVSIDENFNYDDDHMKVISYLGNDSFLEKYKRGEVKKEDFVRPQSRISFLPIRLRIKISNCYHTLFKYTEYLLEERQAGAYLDFIKKTIDSLKEVAEFDVVFSTYGRLENAFAGTYAKKVFDCPYIIDLHDRIAHDAERLLYTRQSKTERECILDSDCCITVTKHYYNDIKAKYPQANVHYLYYGYDENVRSNESYKEGNGILSFCYTGSMYLGKLQVNPLFKALNILKKQHKIALDNIKFYYAGGEFEYIYSQASQYGVENIMENKGYLNRTQIIELQKQSDIIVVAARNRRVQDEIPGKFYEGIRARKPILLLVTGNNERGEMWELQERYNYGHCYETAGGMEAMNQLCSYVLNAYKSAIKDKNIQYNPCDELFSDFRYDVLTNRLEEIMIKLVKAKEAINGVNDYDRTSY